MKQRQTMLVFYLGFRYHVLELSSGISDLSPLQWRHVITLVVIRIVIFFGLVKSIKSIEKVRPLRSIIFIIQSTGKCEKLYQYIFLNILKWIGLQEAHFPYVSNIDKNNRNVAYRYFLYKNIAC
jgi:hypothetical protein